ncbi:prohibitin-2-like isoform X2 [Oryzias latipes]
MDEDGPKDPLVPVPHHLRHLSPTGEVSSLTRRKAQQEAQGAQYYVEEAKQEQRQKILQAEGEAQAAKMAVTKNPGYLNLRKFRVTRNIAKTCRYTFDDGEADLVAQSQYKVYLNADSLVLNLQDKDSSIESSHVVFVFSFSLML